MKDFGRHQGRLFPLLAARRTWITENL